METRKITVVSTRNNLRKVIMSQATTLSELKEDFRNNGIDYDGMTFYEGLSKTELKSDDSILPHDINYKGQVTNDLVFMLTNTNKKIKSGAISRSEAYAAIKARGLQAECIKRFGRNFTMCKTADLISLVEESSKKSAPKVSKPVSSPKKEESKKDTPAVETPQTSSEIVDVKARKAIETLVTMLYEDDTIDYEEKQDILAILSSEEETECSSSKSTIDSPYSDSELDNMFNFVDR